MVTINRKLRSKTETKVNEYIEALEEELLKKETSSLHKFIISADKVAGVLANDLGHLSSGDIEMCQLLTPDKDDKTVDRIMMMLKNTTLFKEIANAADSLIPEIVDEAQDLKLKITDDTASFEQVQKRIRERKESVGK